MFCNVLSHCFLSLFCNVFRVLIACDMYHDRVQQSIKLVFWWKNPRYAELPWYVAMRLFYDHNLLKHLWTATNLWDYYANNLIFSYFPINHWLLLKYLKKSLQAWCHQAERLCCKLKQGCFTIKLLHLSWHHYLDSEKTATPLSNAQSLKVCGPLASAGGNRLYARHQISSTFPLRLSTQFVLQLEPKQLHDRRAASAEKLKCPLPLRESLLFRQLSLRPRRPFLTEPGRRWCLNGIFS